MRLLLTLTLLFGCVPVSHVIIGDTRESIQPSDVKIYIDYPEKYEKIALIDAGSNFAFKDPEILFTWQGKMDKVIERLKIEAAKLGASVLFFDLGITDAITDKHRTYSPSFTIPVN